MATSGLQNEEMEQYIQEIRSIGGAGQASVALATYAFIKLLRHASTFLPGKEWFEMTRKDAEVFIECLESSGMSKNTITLYKVRYIALFNWAIGKDYRSDPVNPFKDMPSGGYREKAIPLVPAHSIFQARMRGNSTLRDAAIFEMCLSTTMRASEIVSITPRMIKVGDAPIDRERGHVSPFVSASITINPTETIVKNNSSKKSWVSKLAMELLCKYIKKSGIKWDSNLPIFPMNQRNMNNIFSDMFDGAELIYPNEMSGSITNADIKESAFSRMQKSLDAVVSGEESLEEDDTPEAKAYLESLMRAAKAEKRSEDMFGERRGVRHVNGKREEGRQRREKVGPHVIRYTSICSMFYRNFDGSRQSEESVRAITGHSKNDNSKSSMLSEYLTSRGFIENDVQWATLWTGRQQHWMLLRSE